MKPLPHQYAVHLDGGTGGYAALSAEGLPNLASAPPPEFDGPGDVPAATERERALRVLQKAAGACVVSGSLAAPVHLEPEIAKEP